VSHKYVLKFRARVAK